MKAGVWQKFLARCREDGALLGILALALAASFYRGHGIGDNYYAISQWLVTYESGFIKRALLGTLIQLEALSKASGISVLILYAVISNAVLVLLHLVTGLVLYRLIRVSPVVLVFVPYFVLGPLLRTQSVYIGYTDQVVALLAIAVVFLMIRGHELFAALLLGVSVLVHETVFALVAPVVAYRCCIQYLSATSAPLRYTHLKNTALLLLLPTLVFALIICWQEIFLPKERILAYLQQMLSRQDPPHYRIDMISEIYTFSFSDWYAIHADAALERMLAWGGLGGYISAIWLPALLIHSISFLSVPATRRCPFMLPVLWAILLSPLVLHWWVVDHDRVSNLVTWVSFLSLWVFVEHGRPDQMGKSDSPGLMFLLMCLGILFPQARSDLSLFPLLLANLPLMAGFLWLHSSFHARKPVYSSPTHRSG